MSVGDVLDAFGAPSDTGDYTIGERRRTWCYYNVGLQATYDKSSGWLVSLAVTKPAPVATKTRSVK